MMRLLEAPVGVNEIDNLGHMNVRFYGQRAWLATKALLEGWGLGSQARRARDLVLIHQDSFNHFLNEQFAGAPLVIDGGVIKAEPDDLRCYYEILNVATGARAAAFVVRPQLQARSTRAPVVFPPDVIEAARAALIDLPAHGAPRSLTLDPPHREVQLADLEHRFRDLEPAGAPDAMIVPESACDETGFMKLASAHDIMHFARTDREDGDGVPVFDLDGDVRFGWAMLENRQIVLATPRAGDAIKTVRAQLRIDRKTQQNRNWTFDKTTGELLSVVDHVTLALDLSARRSVEIPPHVRRDLELRYLPDYA